MDIEKKKEYINNKLIYEGEYLFDKIINNIIKYEGEYLMEIIGMVLDMMIIVINHLK